MSELSELGARERQIADIVLRLGRATVQDVRAEIADAPTYSTVRAMLRMLEEKGFLSHEQDGLKYVYFSSLPKEAVRRKALQHLVTIYFEGSAAAAAAALLELPDERTDPEQFGRLRKLIATKAARKKGR